ncbi:hypothetical protein, partial [Legionella fairfieldensis]
AYLNYLAQQLAGEGGYGELPQASVVGYGSGVVRKETTENLHGVELAETLEPAPLADVRVDYGSIINELNGSGIIAHGNNGQQFIRASISQFNGFQVKKVNGSDKVKILGSQYANKVLGLPDNFRYSKASNLKLLGAKGLYLSYNPLQYYKYTNMTGVLNILDFGIGVTEATYNFYNHKINDIKYVGEIGSLTTGTIFTTGMAAMTSYGVIGLLGASTIAETPIILTVGAAIGVGYTAQKVYSYASPYVKLAYEKTYEWTKNKIFY